MEFLMRLRADSKGIHDLAGNVWIDDIGTPDISNQSPVNSDGKCILFSGAARLKSVITNPEFMVKNTDFTIAYWIKSVSNKLNGGDFSVLLGQYPYDAANLQIYTAEADGYSGVRNTNPAVIPNSESSGALILSNNRLFAVTDVADKNWHHVAFTRKDDTYYVFVDGKLENKYTTTQYRDNEFLATSKSLNLGGCYYERNYAVNAYLDDFCIIKGAALWTDDYTLPNDYLSLTHKLYKDESGAVYGVGENGVFTQFALDWNVLTDAEKIALFNSTSDEAARVEDLEKIKKFNVIIYSEMNNKQKVAVTAIPKDQLVLPKGLINIESFQSIDKVSLTSAVSGEGVCKLLVTTDHAEYKTYDFTAQEWKVVDQTDLAAVKANGIDAAQLQNIPKEAWDALTEGKAGIGFAYLLCVENTTDLCNVDQLALQVDMKGSWVKALHGTEYAYEYPANTVLQVSLLTDGDYKINYCKSVS